MPEDTLREFLKCVYTETEEEDHAWLGRMMWGSGITESDNQRDETEPENHAINQSYP